MSEEKQMHEEDFDWGEEIPEDWEDEEEDEEEFPAEKLLSETLTAESPILVVPQIPGYSVTFKHVALGSENASECRHIVEVISDDTAGQKFVLARLVPNYCEAVSLDLRVPPATQQGEIRVCLVGEGKLGPVDIVVLMQREGDDSHSECSSCCGGSDSEEEEEKKASPCEGKPCCQGKTCIACPCKGQCKESEQPETSVMKTLQQQKEELMKAREAKEKQREAREEQKQKEQQKDPKQPFNPFETKETKEAPAEQKRAAFREFKGVQIKDVVVGNGPEAKHGRKLRVSYVLRLNNESGKILDSSKNKKFDFRLGAGEVISGWDIGVANMRVGGKRVLIIPPRLGYGAQRSGQVPANATLCFEIELFNVM